MAPLEGDAVAAQPASPGSSDGWTSKVELPSGAAQCPPCPACEPCSSEASAAQATTVLVAPEDGSGLNCAEVMGRCRQESLAKTTPHIIECSEAGEGGSQEVNRLFCTRNIDNSIHWWVGREQVGVHVLQGIGVEER